MQIQNLNKHFDLRLVKVEKIKEKKKWLYRFIKSYSLGVTVPSIEMFQDHICEFYVAIDSGNECGYIRIRNREIANHELGNLAFRFVLEAYVKPAYRRRGILRFMLEEAIRSLQVLAIRIDADRFGKHLWYYRSLGFTFGYRDESGNLLTVCHENSRALFNKIPIDKEASNEKEFRKTA
jgi:GNAT superfamily N-acetyltransferase